MDGLRRFSCLIALCAALASTGAAQTGGPNTGSQVATPAPAAPGNYQTRYDLLLGGTVVDVNGSDDKFRTDRNTRSGFDTGRIYFDARPVDPDGAKFDHLTLNGFGFGGSSPYQRADFRVNKSRLYDLKAGYRQYYNFFRLPEFALGYHDEDSVGRAYNVSLELFPHRTASVIAGYRRNQLFGTRFTSQELRFDTYPVSYPRRLASDEIFGGFKLNSRTASFRFIQSYIRTKDDQQLLPNGDNSIGFRENVLAAGVRNVPTRITTPVSKLFGAFHPSPRYEITARYLYSGADMDLTRYEDLLNRVGGGLLPVRQIISSSGVSEKPTHNLGLSQTLDIVPRLTLHHRLVYDKYTLTGFLNTEGLLRMIDDALGTSVDIPFTDAGGTVTEYKLVRNETELEFSVVPSLALVGGHRYSDRHLAFGENGSNPRPVVTIRNAGTGGVVFRPGPKLRVRAEVEKGTASTAFNRIDPLDTLRWTIKGRFQPVRHLSLTANVLFEDNQNDTPGINHDLDNRQVGLQATYALADGILATGGYNYLRLRTSTDIVYYALSEMVNGLSLYETNTHLVNALIEAPLGSHVRVRGGYDYFKDTGESFPLRMHVPKLGLSVLLGHGISFEADWKYYSYNERIFDLRDYNANVLSIGIRFQSSED